MPLSRYQIRNVYSFADPELYGAADKDDPEALLEGIAMAGLVGVLRQLGDLAEFAAEIFRDLHEEVATTAARGHGLLARVQQLESEFPSIERAFLSQTRHSAFFSYSGIDWHPNLQTEQNLITKGDLPRFVMDSYEECRGPPRLFLLDKFDVAGAGACLKRYTDPSFYKVETTSYDMESAETQRDKKIRKTKKKGSRWKKEEPPKFSQSSHAKLHQLFQEEHMQNGVNEPSRRVKLKKRPEKLPLNSESGKSYMERLLTSPSEDKLVHEVPLGSSHLTLPSNSYGGPGFEVLEVSTVGLDLGPTRPIKSPSVSSGGQEEADEKNIEVDEQFRTHGIQNGYFASETDSALPLDQGVIMKESTSREADLNELSSNHSEKLDSPKKTEEHQADPGGTFDSSSRLSDFPSPTTDNLSSLSFVRNPEAELDNEDHSANSSPMVHLPDIDTTREITEDSLIEANQAENVQDHCREDSVDSQCSSPSSVTSHVDQRIDICDPDAKPSEATFRDDPKVAEDTTDIPETLGDDAVHKSDSAEDTIVHSNEDENEETGTEIMNSKTEVSDPAEVDRNGSNEDNTELEVGETGSINSEAKSVIVAEHKGLSTLEDDAEMEREAKSVNSETEENVSDFVPFGVDKNEDISLSSLEEPDENGLAINQPSMVENSDESSEKEEVDQHTVISPELVLVPCGTSSYDNSGILLHDSSPNSSLAACDDVNQDDVDDPPANSKAFEDQNRSNAEETDQNGLQAIILSDLDSKLGSASDLAVSTEAVKSLFPDVASVSSSSNCTNQDLEHESLNQVDQFDRFEATLSILSESTPLENKVDKPIGQPYVQSSSESCFAPVSEDQSMLDLPEMNTHKVNFSDQVISPATPEFSGFGMLPQLSPVNIEEMPPLPPLPPMQWRMGKLQNASLTSRTGDGQLSVDHSIPVFPSEADETPQLKPILALPDTGNQESQYGYEDLQDGMANLSKTSSTETSVEKHDNSFISSEAKAVKIQRPRSPLVDAVAAHDKSKLRKVLERAPSHIPKEDRRDTILEQIRAKSFNLKPAVHTRPSIQGPQTNLRVAAILEKANAIRQALVGSDDDDSNSDGWSD